MYTQTRLPRGVYGTTASTDTVSVANYLVALRELDERIAYRLTAMLFEHRAELGGSGATVRRSTSTGARRIDTSLRSRLHTGARAVLPRRGAGLIGGGQDDGRPPARAVPVKFQPPTAPDQESSGDRQAEARAIDVLVARAAPEALGGMPPLRR